MRALGRRTTATMVRSKPKAWLIECGYYPKAVVEMSTRCTCTGSVDKSDLEEFAYQRGVVVSAAGECHGLQLTSRTRRKRKSMFQMLGFCGS